MKQLTMTAILSETPSIFRLECNLDCLLSSSAFSYKRCELLRTSYDIDIVLYVMYIITGEM